MAAYANIFTAKNFIRAGLSLIALTSWVIDIKGNRIAASSSLPGASYSHPGVTFTIVHPAP